MMKKFIKVVGGVVTASILAKTCPEGFIEAEDESVEVGMVFNSETGQYEEAAKTFDEELQEINEAHDIKVDALVNDYTRAMTFDGSSEAEKVTEIRAELNTARSQYEIDVEQLAIKHYG